LIYIPVLTEIINLVYPNLCQACGNGLVRGEMGICTFCYFHLPKTGFHHDEDNPVFRTFWGRVNIEMAAAFLHFNKGGNVQTLLHKLKYAGNQEIGIYFGKTYGAELMKSGYYKDVDVILPVPLFWKRKKKRGYNQSELIARGISMSMKDAALNTRSFIRKLPSTTQTKKSRYQRWKNVEKIFTVKNEKPLTGKHILLVDDVITTGATIEACASVLLKVPGVRVSVCAVAYTD
jgi:ComF family protein